MKSNKLCLWFSCLFLLFFPGCIKHEQTPPYFIKSATITYTSKQINIRTKTPSPTKQIINIATSQKTESTNNSFKETSTPTATIVHNKKSNSILNGWIVFTDHDSVIISRLDGKGHKRIFDGLCYPTEVSWSHNGDWIAFIDQAACGKTPTQIYLVRPDGSDYRRLTYSDDWKDFIAWSPSGNSILFRQDIGEMFDRKFDLYVYDLDIPKITRLTYSDELPELLPVFSPDGNKILFLTGSDKFDKLMVMDSDGTNLSVLYESTMTFGEFDWSPDGSTIVFAARMDINGCGDLYKLDLNRITVDLFIDSENHLESPVWTNDGKFIGFISQQCINDWPASDYQFNLVRSDGSESKSFDRSLFIHNDLDLIVDYDISPFSALEKDLTYFISDFGNNLRLCSDPALSSTIYWLKSGDQIKILDGPIENDGFLWWFVESNEKTKTGWIIEIPGYFIPVDKHGEGG